MLERLLRMVRTLQEQSTLMCHTCIAEVEELERYWYKPNFTREEAVEVISHAEPGSFIVRDSQSVLRGYALTIKVSEIIIRRKLKVPAGVFVC